ncbi:hypothetical protein DFH27DRAFT_644520 [Peziza echinospora]|nr:hypothetical protein DFH27DRAFT_644520 [Peziza echinospora]
MESALPPATLSHRHSLLSDNYPNAYSDFYGSGTPCVFKSGPDWQASRDHWQQPNRIEREPRPVYGHAIGDNWLSIGEDIYLKLDSIGVKWTSINPLAYANAGEAKPFCTLIISIGVVPHSLLYSDAVAAATAVKGILADAGFPDIDVAFVESVVTRSVSLGPKLSSLDPVDRIPDLRKPFTNALGLSIAPLKYPYYEGTAALYFHLDDSKKRTAILTCAHVARPLPVYANTGMMRENTSPAREEFVALGHRSYKNAVEAMMGTIHDLTCSIDHWKSVLGDLGAPVEGEDDEITSSRKDLGQLVAMATAKIGKVKVLHGEATRRRATLDQRVIGFVLHSEKIGFSVKPHGFTKDWALIELYDEKIDWSTFSGNKVYIGGNLSVGDFCKTMFPHPDDRANCRYPKNGLLQANGIVQDKEIRKPQHLDVHGDKCLFVVKNGSATGTTVGRVSGLESFTRTFNGTNINHTSIEIAVLPYDRKRGKFSDSGDSGSIVLDRDGRIVGILTGGSGPTDDTDISYLTPYWWAEQQIKAKYPNCSLYKAVQ